MSDANIRKRNIANLTLTNIQAYIQELNEVSIHEIEVQLELLDNARSSFLEAQAKIEEKSRAPAEGEEDQNAVERTHFDRKYVTLKGKLRSLMPPVNLQHQGNVHHTPSMHVELPKINLPVFDGKYTEWKAFQDMFQSVVHKEKRLSAVQKLQYLKSSLKGEPAKLIQNLQTTEANYEQAWEILTSRYDNLRVTVFTHIKALFNMPVIHAESATGLRKLLNVVMENLVALEVLEQPVKQWDALLIYFIQERLDAETRKHWELSLTMKDMPSLKQLTNFLDNRCRALEASGLSISKSKPFQRENSFAKKVTVHQAAVDKCIKCTDDHRLYQCPTFRKMSPQDKMKFVDKNRVCKNCLNLHPSDKCTFGHCKKCKEYHHTSLHIDNAQQDKPRTSQAVTMMVQNQNYAAKSTPAMLATAVVGIKHQGRLVECRVLVDPGAQTNLITDRLVQKLNINRIPDSTTIVGVGCSPNAVAQGRVNLTIRSKYNSFKIATSALVMSQVTSHQPVHFIDSSWWKEIKELKLADDQFNIPAEIDMLIGAGVFPKILKAEKRDITNGPTAIDTELGWIIMGNFQDAFTREADAVSSVFTNLTTLQNQLQKFWQIEEAPSKGQFLTAEERECEDHFVSTHRREKSGRYTLELPFKKDAPTDLGKSRDIALQRLLSLEKRLAKDPDQDSQYKAFMKEYEELGQMEETVPDSQVPSYYIPHFAIQREESTTTKLRVVFNASAKTNKSLSLNSQLLVGPTIQDTLVAIIMRFRLYYIAITADIEKMYRQIWINPIHQNMQRILWRPSPDQPVKDFILKTVTYGTSSAPFQAIRTLHQLAEDGEKEHPIAAALLKKAFYVDDLITGADTEEEAVVIQDDLSQLLSSGGFNLRKWSSSHPHCLRNPENPSLLKFQDTSDISGQSIRTLGILWNPQTDQFHFQVNSEYRDKPTKRSVLSDIAKLYDPLGWLAPCILVGKILMQRLWIARVDWDDELPDNLHSQWMTFVNELPLLSKVQINRFISSCKGSTVQIHGFCDGSEDAYGAVIYSRVTQPDGTVIVSLLCSKTRVAPVKQISIPKLELCGALLLAQLLQWVQTTLNVADSDIHAWTDSTIVLHWISCLPRRWKTFVANRVAEIQQLVPTSKWHHVRTYENPADCASRGLTASQLIDHSLWWNGPVWLTNSNIDFTTQHWSPPVEEEEVRAPEITVAVSCTNEVQLERFSSLSKLVRVTAYMLRFIHNARVPAGRRQVGCLTTKELHEALLHRVKNVQHEHFQYEIRMVTKQTALSNKTKLSSLNPFLDSDGLLRVGGRLQKAMIPYSQQHQLILPSKSHLTKLIVRDAHLRHLHAETTLLLAVLRRTYWILRSRDVIRSTIHHCISCVKAKAQTASQLMGSLPAPRVNQARAFLHCGVDYAGPHLIKAKTGRGSFQKVKGYIVVFVCFAVKAVHLELATDLSTECFLASFRRFVSRRGVPSDMYSDCGTNFVGAHADLKELQAVVNSAGFNRQVQKQLSSFGTTWHFNPPSMPHAGGLWEAAVKSTKKHLRRVIGDQLLTYEELYTVLTEIEGCLNSRPLCAVSDQPDDMEPLTPGHFLIGQPITSLPALDVVNTPNNRLSRWQLLTKMVQGFWTRWSSEYLHQLQPRQKWRQKEENLRCGDLVLIKNEATRVCEWPLGLIVKVHEGEDGVVRVATVKFKGGLVKRPIVKLVKLPVEEMQS